jgi:formate dehydrogenase beta subunit
MTLIPRDMTPVYKATIAKGTNAIRWQRAEYVDLLPPCNNACPAGLNIQARVALAQAGRYEDAWRTVL